MHPILKIGDRVRYATAWLRATGQLAGDILHAKGRVIGLSPVSKALDVVLIEWDRPDVPAKVLSSNLERVK